MPISSELVLKACEVADSLDKWFEEKYPNGGPTISVQYSPNDDELNVMIGRFIVLWCSGVHKAEDLTLGKLQETYKNDVYELAGPFLPDAPT